MKNCLKCQESKPLSDFGRDVQKKDGLNAYCKLCIRKRNIDFRKNHPDYRREYYQNYREENREKLRAASLERFRNNREDCLKANRISYYKHKDEIAKKRKLVRMLPENREKNRVRVSSWRKKNKQKCLNSINKWKERNKDKYNAHRKVHWAVSRGYLLRSPECQECKKNCKTEGHHEDYSKQLDVIWLCRLCHAKKIETVEVSYQSA
jgi:hypothetical protein